MAKNGKNLQGFLGPVAPPEPDTRKDSVIAFRVTGAEFQRLLAEVEKPRIVGIASPNDFARKLILDFFAHRVVYLTRQDRIANPSLK